MTRFGNGLLGDGVVRGARAGRRPDHHDSSADRRDDLELTHAAAPWVRVQSVPWRP
jgi:hypothetical protein